MIDALQTDTIDYKQLLQETVRLLDLQRTKPLYRMDEQIKTQKQVKEFIERHRQ